MTKKKTKTKSKETPSFENALDQLKICVNDLEDGNLSLSESLDVYERGVKHLKQCHLALQDAKKRIELLVEIDEQGNLVTEPFDDAATHPTTVDETRATDAQEATIEPSDVVDDGDRLF